MKKTAFLIIILFAVIQALPALKTIWGNDLAMVPETIEEKKINKDDTKSGKEYLSLNKLNLGLSVKRNAQVHLAEAIMPSPCFEKLTPPPDFS